MELDTFISVKKILKTMKWPAMYEQRRKWKLETFELAGARMAVEKFKFPFLRLHQNISLFKFTGLRWIGE